jgi:intracellular sulfur oxidation DsrE/DsrF family protein
MLSSKKLLSIAGAIALSATLVGCNSGGNKVKAKNGYYKQKVVYHINNINHSYGALRNIKNHLNALGDKNVEIIVVTHSKGAFTLVDGSHDKKGHTFESTIQALANRGVKFQICANTIRGKKIDKSKINLNAKVIPSGVAHLAHLQQLGYYYIKP